MPEAFDRYVAAWNAGDLDAWLEAHAEDAEYTTFAGPEPRTFEGRLGLREVGRRAGRTGTGFTCRCSMWRTG